MRNILKKPFRWAVTFTVILALFTSYVLLDTFVIPRAGVPVTTSPAATTAAGKITTLTKAYNNTQAAETAGSETGSAANSAAGTSSDPVITDLSYADENIKITIEKIYQYDTWIYIADVQVSSIAYLQSAFANDTYGRNIKATTSAMAEDQQAILAINGDYYGFRNYGFVLRNGVLYRSTASGANSDEALVIDSEGNFSIIRESLTSAQSLADAGAWQIWSFGPALINDGDIAVNASSEVGQAKTSNPRTAIGQISALHYLFVVSDGRTSESAGLSLLELAKVF